MYKTTAALKTQVCLACCTFWHYTLR